MKETPASKDLRELFTELAHGFTTHHDSIRVEMNQSANFVALTVTAHAEDSAKLIGRGAQNFNAMRNLLNFAANKLNVRFHLSRIKDLNGTRVPDLQASSVSDDEWPQEEISRLASDTCDKLFKGSCSIVFENQGKKSIINITVGEDEPFIIPEVQVEESLDIIFAAIGQNKGRKISVRLQRNKNLNAETPTKGNLSHGTNPVSPFCRR